MDSPICKEPTDKNRRTHPFRKSPFSLFKPKFNNIIIVDLSSEVKLVNLNFEQDLKITAADIHHDIAIDKKESLQEAIRKFIRINKIAGKNVILCPCIKSLFLKRIRLPAVGFNELQEAIKWKIKDELGFDISKAIIDYQLIHKVNQEDGSAVLDIICVATEEEEIRKQVVLLKDIGLTCLAVNVMPFSYRSIISKCFNSSNLSLGVIDMAGDYCYFAVYKDNKLDFYRQIPMSMSKLEDSLSAELSADNKTRLKLEHDEIEDVLYNFGIPLNAYVYKEKMNSNQILAMLRPSLEKMLQELRRSLDYYSSEFHQIPPSKIIVTGEAARIKNFDTFLKNSLDIDVAYFSLEDVLKSTGSLSPQVLTSIVGCVGLALDYDKNINILPYEFRTEKIEVIQKISLRWVLSIAFLLLLFSYILAKATVTSYKRRLDNSLIHLNVLSQIKDIQEKKNSLDRFIKETKEKNAPIAEALSKLSNIVPFGMFFDEMSINFQEKTGVINGFIKGTDINPDTILAKFIDAMNDYSYFKDISISKIERAGVDVSVVSKFQITFKLS